MQNRSTPLRKSQAPRPAGPQLVARCQIAQPDRNFASVNPMKLEHATDGTRGATASCNAERDDCSFRVKCSA